MHVGVPEQGYLLSGSFFRGGTAESGTREIALSVQDRAKQWAGEVGGARGWKDRTLVELVLD